MNYIGIDLAWTYKNESGICIISDKGKIELCEAKVYTDEQLIQIINQYSKDGALVAIDAPLIVENDSGSRKCERELQSNKINGFQVSVRSSSKSFMDKSYRCIRGVELVENIRHAMPYFTIDIDIWNGTYNIIEVFPTGSCIGLFPEIAPIKYKIDKKRPLEMSKAEILRLLTFVRQNLDSYADINNFDEFFDPALDIQSMSERQYKHFEDKLDAFLCSLTACYCHRHKEDTRTFGNIQEGFIMLPVVTKGSEVIKSTALYNQNISEMLKSIEAFHKKNNFDIGTKNQATMLYRMNLLMEELGEISQCITKGKGNIAEEHADLLILLLGNCITMDIDIVKAFWDKYNIIMNRTSKKVGTFERVSDWNDKT